MSEVWRLLQRSASFLRLHPVMWLPVLVTQVLDFLVRFGVSLGRQPMLVAVAPRSVTGGLSGGTNTAVLLVSALLTWGPIVLQVLLVVYSLGVCAKWSQALRGGEPGAPRGWQVAAGSLLRASALTFFISALTVGLGTYLTLRGGVPVRWAPLVVECFLVAASWFVLPVWLRFAAEQQGVHTRSWPVLPAFLAMLAGVLGIALCSFAVSEVQLRLMQTGWKVHPTAIAFVLNLAGACLESLPLAFSLIALSRYAAERPGVALE